MLIGVSTSRGWIAARLVAGASDARSLSSEYTGATL